MIRISILATLVLLVCFCTVTVRAAQRKAIPPLAEQQKASLAQHTKFNQLYDQFNPAGFAACANALQSYAEATASDAEAYVALREAARLYALAGDVSKALAAGERLSTRFAVDPLDEAHHILLKATLHAHGAAAFDEIANGYLHLADMAQAAKRPMLARQAHQQARQLAHLFGRSQTRERARKQATRHKSLREVNREMNQPPRNTLKVEYDGVVVTRPLTFDETIFGNQTWRHDAMRPWRIKSVPETLRDLCFTQYMRDQHQAVKIVSFSGGEVYCLLPNTPVGESRAAVMRNAGWQTAGQVSLKEGEGVPPSLQILHKTFAAGESHVMQPLEGNLGTPVLVAQRLVLFHQPIQE